jgi:PIN domain nuclease of toxin-antitoxin system
MTNMARRRTAYVNIAEAKARLSELVDRASLRHVCRAADMPFHHRDPFDRVIIAQTQLEDIAVVSNDPVFDAYGVNRIW